MQINLIFQKVCLLIYLFVATFCLGGCIAHKTAEIADRKAAPRFNCEYLKIQRIISAVKYENGDISICVSLVNPAKTENPKLKTITLPFSDKTKTITAGAKLESNFSGCPIGDDLYPIKKTKTGCDITGAKNVPPMSVLPIEKLDIGNNDRDMLYDLLSADNKGQQATEKIYEIQGKFSKHVLLAYWPINTDQQSVQPIIIAGTYEDRSTGIYKLLVIPALVADVLYFFVTFILPFMWI
jgi:hypothetical protein